MVPAVQPDTRIGVQAAGSISFPAAVYEALGRPARVVVDYDRSGRIIVMSATTAMRRGSYAVLPNGTGGASYRVAAKRLCGQLGLLGSARRYPARVFSEGVVGMILGEEIHEDG